MSSSGAAASVTSTATAVGVNKKEKATEDPSKPKKETKKTRTGVVPPKSVLDKIVYAIRKLKDPSTKGSSRTSIVKFLKEHLEYDNLTAIKKALKVGCTINILQQQGQSFRVVGDPCYHDEDNIKLPKLIIEDIGTAATKKKKGKGMDNGGGDGSKPSSSSTTSDNKQQTVTAQHGDLVTMSYRGTLNDLDGYEFDKATKFEFMLGVGDVIKGWDEGIVGMSVGQKRRLIVPPHLGYGKRGCSPDIPPNSTLHFIVTLKKITKQTPSNS